MRGMWWAEWQRRGAIHFHAIIVDHHFATEGQARRWFTDHWKKQLPAGVFRAQPDTKLYSAWWMRNRSGNYILKDVRKIHGKTYQQDYTRMPKGWRTFSSHQLEFTAAEHELHESHARTVCTAAPEASFAERQHHIWIYRIDRHVPARGGCKLISRRRRKGRLLHNSEYDVCARL